MATIGNGCKDLVFVTYAHEDEKWKDMLLPQFEQLERLGELSVWDDRQIKAGEDWYARIKDVLDRTKCAVCLISANFLNSAFCMDEEIPYLLQKRRKAGIEIIPILIEDCVWEAHRWLKRGKMLPRDGQTVADDFADRSARIFADAARQVWDSLQPGYVYYRPPSGSPPPEKADISRLPETGALLFGRRRELQFLDDAWHQRRLNVAVFRASGGVGKSTLVRCWVEELDEDNFLGAERVFAWSFHQGASDNTGRQGQMTSADEFLGTALEFFGDSTRGEGLSPWDRGQRLAEKIREKRTLLLLDGMEPLQSSHAVVRPGEITDPGLATLVQELARQNPGLCIISTREWIADLNDEEFEERVAQIELDTVSPLAGRALLRERGVSGDDEQLEVTVKAFGGHAFALQLLGRYLEFYGSSDIGAAGDIPAGDDLPGVSRHPRRVMAAFATKFGEASAELQLLRTLGLFDRPAEQGAIEALRAEPGIAGLTDRLVGLEQSAWINLLDRLRASGLLAPQNLHSPDEIDAHPLIREHFGAGLRKLSVDSWRQGHGRLNEHFRSIPEKEHPDTFDEMAPLFQAVFHGCQAGRHQETLEHLYWGRIQRGREGYSWRKLGAFGADLAALSNFFEHRWTTPVAGISDVMEAFLLNEVGFHLRALGRLREAVEPMRAGLENYIRQENWRYAVISASNLSELHLTLGEVAKAVARAEESVAHADHSGDWRQRMLRRTDLAAAQHQAGERERALALFEEAEALQAEDQPEYPRLYSVEGFEYCDLLLDLGRQQEVRERATQTLEWSKLGGQGSLLTIALDHLSLGRAEFVAWQADQSGDLAVAAEELNQAVDGLRQAGTIHHVPRGLLARAALFRMTGDLARSRRDLDAALRISKRSEMRLFECDAHLEAAHLHLAQSNLTAARAALDQAKTLMTTTGYHRRDRDVAEIEAALS